MSEQLGNWNLDSLPITESDRKMPRIVSGSREDIKDTILINPYSIIDEAPFAEIENSPLDSYSPNELAIKMGEAEAYGDKKTVLEISDVIQDHLIKLFDLYKVPAEDQDKRLDSIIALSEQRKSEILSNSSDNAINTEVQNESLPRLPRIVVDQPTTPEVTLPVYTSEKEEELFDSFSKARADYIASTVSRRGKLRSKDKALNAAQERYQSSRDQYLAEVIKSNRAAKISDEVIKNKLKIELLREADYVSTEIAVARIELANNKLLSGVYHWFDSKLQTNLLSKAGLKDLFTGQGMKDFLKRSGAMSAIMIPVGIGAGLAGSVALGPIAGAVAGAYLGRGIARGVANNKISREGKTASNAQLDSMDEIQKLTDRASKIDMLEGSTSAITDIIGNKTDSLTRRNRRRTLGAVAIGAGTGLVGGAIGDIAHNVLNSGTGGTTQSLKPVSHSVRASRPSSIPKHIATTTHTTETLASATTQAPNIDPSQYAGYQNQDPWNYFANPNQGGSAANATPTIEYLANKAQAAGWKVNSFSSGINSMTAPNGTVYNTTPEIIAALEYFKN